MENLNLDHNAGGSPREILADTLVEILPPKRKKGSRGNLATCQCCGRRRTIDEDCCGICEECLAS
ncbi:hypothetical protein [Rhizobium leguminosarum]|uniref:hypothetical protein n=1 Tax=Rhizobium leguminosarum TaxID=384 RepID=UPI001030DD3A|nr:hypothetical protein [Rhizobium leguminosarum]TAW53266.1 hypothetical protein ELI14_19165 [Rhizobium leguminosarum]